MSLCVGAHGWVAGIASHGSVLLSRGWLITVEAPGHPGHPPSTQLDAVVNNNRKSSLRDKYLMLPIQHNWMTFLYTECHQFLLRALQLLPSAMQIASLINWMPYAPVSIMIIMPAVWSWKIDQGLRQSSEYCSSKSNIEPPSHTYTHINTSYFFVFLRRNNCIWHQELHNWQQEQAVTYNVDSDQNEEQRSVHACFDWSTLHLPLAQCGDADDYNPESL